MTGLATRLEVPGARGSSGNFRPGAGVRRLYVAVGRGRGTESGRVGGGSGRGPDYARLDGAVSETGLSLDTEGA